MNANKDFIFRAAKGKKIMPEIIKKSATLRGFSVTPSDFLHLEQTDKIKERFFNFVKNGSGFKCYFSRENIDRFFIRLEEKDFNEIDERLLLFGSFDEYVGALLVPLSFVYNNKNTIFEFVEQDLAMATIDLTHGFCLELNYYDQDGTYVKEGIFELTAWGFFEEIFKLPVE